MAASDLVCPLHPCRAPTQQHETFQHYISTRAAFVEWYEESKAIRMGHATGLFDLIRAYAALIEASISREDGRQA
ncbi:hypothetical protein I315_04958 [Cryptococcus gattii Ru294]|nr:hypothetical protein I315_04958 [Cryptococcus gattii Ru294]